MEPVCIIDMHKTAEMVLSLNSFELNTSHLKNSGYYGVGDKGGGCVWGGGGVGGGVGVHSGT